MFRRSTSYSRIAVFLAVLMYSIPAPAQTPPSTSPTPAPTADQAQILKSTEAFVRELFAWGPDFKIRLGPMTPSVSPDFYNVPIQITMGGRTDFGIVYVSKDGKTFFRGDIYNMSASPFAEVLAHM